MAHSKNMISTADLLSGTQELFAIAMRALYPICLRYDTAEICFGGVLTKEKITTNGFIALKRSLTNPLDHVVLVNGKLALLDVIPATVVSLKNSENWLAEFTRFGTNTSDSASMLDYWKEVVVNKFNPEKMILLANKANIEKWVNNRDIVVSWDVDTELFFYNTGLNLGSSVQDFRNSFGFLLDESIRTKLKSVFSKGIDFFIEVSNTIEIKKAELYENLASFINELVSLYDHRASVELLDKNALDEIFYGKSKE